MQDWAIFTGDIVRSGDLDADGLSHVFTALQTYAAMIANWPHSTLPPNSTPFLHSPPSPDTTHSPDIPASPDTAPLPRNICLFTRFRGDGWQMALPPVYALRAALGLRAAVIATGKGRDTRIGIGIGAGRIIAGDLAGAEGPAFVQSGRALDLIKRGPLMTAPNAPRALRACLPLADRIARGWTVKQAEIASVLLSPVPPTHTALAKQLGQSRQLIQKQAEAAGLAALLTSCETLEEMFAEE